MKRIILAVVTILASAGLTFAATTAAWTDTATATDIVIQSGSADLRIWTSISGAYGEIGDSPFNVTGLEPGVTKDGGSAFWLKQFVLDSSASGMTLKGKIASSLIEPTPAPNESNLEIQVYEIGDATGTESLWYSLSEWKSSGRNLNSTLDISDREKEYGIRVRFVDNPDNNWQAKTLKFNLEVTGTTSSGT